MGEVRDLIDQTFERDAAGELKENVVIVEGSVDVVVRGEPFLGSTRTVTHGILHAEEFSRFFYQEMPYVR